MACFLVYGKPPSFWNRATAIDEREVRALRWFVHASAWAPDCMPNAHM
jgi:hypothetical protein